MPPNRFDRAAPPRQPKAPGKAFLARLDRLRRLASSCGAAVERSTRSVTSPTTVSGLAGELCPRGVRSHARKTLAEGIEREAIRQVALLPGRHGYLRLDQPDPGSRGMGVSADRRGIQVAEMASARRPP